ncbi:MAG: asparagine--tRNA ligase, partial [Firmicutes bacterium]|nr:asparagine--tRNA ligase [Bacillota bacterium]
MVDLKDVFAGPEQFAGEIEVEGWIRNNRGSNKFGFIELNDGTYFKSVQVVHEEEFLENFREVAALPLSTAVSVK